MGTQMVAPSDVVVSDYNERQSFDSDELDELVDSVERSGIVEPPLVTENEDGEYAAYVGQRRVAAAEQAGIEEIPVIVNDTGEEEALVASITENTALFSEDVSPDDRGQAIKRLWEMMGGSGTPVFSHIGAKLGVPADTVRTWWEPMREEWQGTDIDPSSSSDDDDGPSGGFFDGEDTLGERSLSEVRQMTDDKDERERAAKTAAELGASQADLNDAKQKAEATDLPASKAIEDIVGEESSKSGMNVEVTFEPDLSEDVEQFAEREGMDEAEVIEEAVRRYIGAEQEDTSQRPTPTTGSDLL